MVEKTKVLHHLRDNLVSAVFEDGSDDGFECRSDHFGGLIICSDGDENAPIDAVVKPTLSQGVITQKFVA
jgi:hypothetical protein